MACPTSKGRDCTLQGSLNLSVIILQRDHYSLFKDDHSVIKIIEQAGNQSPAAKPSAEGIFKLQQQLISSQVLSSVL